MTFRKFGIISSSGKEHEVLLNTDKIKYIWVAAPDNATIIDMDDGVQFVSSIEYRHLADAMDGFK